MFPVSLLKWIMMHFVLYMITFTIVKYSIHWVCHETFLSIKKASVWHANVGVLMLEHHFLNIFFVNSSPSSLFTSHEQVISDLILIFAKKQYIAVARQFPWYLNQLVSLLFITQPQHQLPSNQILLHPVILCGCVGVWMCTCFTLFIIFLEIS